MTRLTTKLLLLSFITFTTCLAAKKADKPNIILIMTDDQGWHDVGFNGNTQLQTPNIDAIAKQGLILDRFYAASAVCSPTRASIMTGRNPLRTNIPYANEGHLMQGEITIAELVKKQGYATGHFGKWHLGTLTKTVKDANRGGRAKFENEYTIPSEHGYDHYFCSESKVPTYDPMVYPNKFIEGEGKRYGWRAVQDPQNAKTYGTAYWYGDKLSASDNLEGDDSRIIMDRVIPFIEESQQNNQPFFSTIWFHTPHLPVVSDSTHRNLYKTLDLQTQIYYGTITAMDEQLGRLWEKLDDMNIQGETLIMFCSDNGPERNTPGSAGEFREGKRSLYEGGVRVPAFAVWTNQIAGGRRTFHPASTSDYLPTILDILDIDYPDTRPIDGTSILGALVDDHKVRNKAMGFICRPNVSWVTHQYKLIADEKLEHFELYDLLHDRSETNNVIERYPRVATKLKADLSEWLLSVENSQKGLDY